MWGEPAGRSRGVSPVIGTVLLVAITVLLAGTASLMAFGFELSPTAPQVELSHDTVDAGSEQSVAVTLEAGSAVKTDRLFVIASTDVDIGGPPDDPDTPANEDHASELEKFTESDGDNPPQVGIGDTWESGETVYIDPVGSVDDVTIGVYWSDRAIVGVNPGTVRGEYSYELLEFTL